VTISNPIHPPGVFFRSPLFKWAADRGVGFVVVWGAGGAVVIWGTKKSEVNSAEDFPGAGSEVVCTGTRFGTTFQMAFRTKVLLSRNQNALLLLPLLARTRDRLEGSTTGQCNNGNAFNPGVFDSVTTKKPHPVPYKT